MKRICAYPRWLWIVSALACLSVTAGISLARIEPSGRKTRLIQFDAINELNMDEGFTNWVVFARYWVCQDYYAVSVVWSEPHGGGMQDMTILVVLGDRSALRINDDTYRDWVPLNTTYPRPLGERGAFRWGGGMYELAEMRFAEAEALARRVYVSDLGAMKDASQDTDGVVDRKVPEGADGMKRKLARLRARVKDNRIESMELLDARQRSLGTMKYEYAQSANVSPLVKLVAELPARPEKLAVNANVTTKSSRGEEKTYQVKEVDHVHHRGGRTCTVTYKDVTIGDKALRLPVQVEVRISESKRLLRSARLMNFKRVDLDKAGVWEAARAFAHLSNEDQAYHELVGKYINAKPKLVPVRIDPNDLAFVRRLIAKYPVAEVPPPPHEPGPQARKEQREGELAPEARVQQARARAEARQQERAQWQKEMKKWQEQVARMPKPQRMEVEPNDVRVMRQLDRHYTKGLSNINGPVPKSKQEIFDLRDKLREILSYHRVPLLPEERPPEVEPTDRELIRQLQVHYGRLATQQDRGLGGQLKAAHALTRLDRMLKDYGALERHTTRYLQMLGDAGLAGAYMVGGHGNIETLVLAGQYEKANKLLREWADRSAAENGADAVFRFAGWDIEGNKRDPWASVQLLDRFLKRPGMSPIQRYEGLALRAIALHRVDRLLADPETDNSELRKTQAQWVLIAAKKENLTKRVEPALHEALAAWQSLGAARSSEAKPYSTANVGAYTMNFMGFPEATRLQETSALLDSVIRERAGQTTAGQPRTGP